MIEVQHLAASVIHELLTGPGFEERARYTERDGKPLGGIYYAEYGRG